MRLFIWTDGAIVNGGNRDGSGIAEGGIGVVIAEQDDSIVDSFSKKYIGPTAEGSYDQVTVNRMEMRAAIEGLKFFIKEYEFEKKDVVTIKSDSAYLVNSAMKYLKKWKSNGWKTNTGQSVKNRDLWEELDEIFTSKNRPKLLFKHVKGHSGIPLNEEADRLAQSEVREIKGAEKCV